LLREETRVGRLSVANPAFAAAQFLNMVISVPRQRALGLGKPMTAAECEAWARDTVSLFLKGCQPR
jgi:hypothetical protein